MALLTEICPSLLNNEQAADHYDENGEGQGTQMWMQVVMPWLLPK